jgi:ketosteroid isomerase-like protein
MKTHLLAGLVLAFATAVFAERPSNDEVAVRLGVNEWLAARSTESGHLDFAKLKALYLANLEFTDPVTGEPASTRGLQAYTARLQPLLEQVQSHTAVADGDVRVVMNGDSATSVFSVQSRGVGKDGHPIACGGRVNLTWVRHDGFWQVAREEVTPLTAKAPGKVAASK